MIFDILKVFQNKYEEVGDKLILDNYVLKDGLYVKINKDSSLEYYVKSSKKIKVDGKTQTEHYFEDIDNNMANEKLDWFKQRDYFSNVIEPGKSYDAPKKTIHNNNYLSLFMKIEPFLEVDFAHLKEKLYKKVLSFKDFNSKNEKKILSNFSNNIKKFSRKKDVVKKMRQVEKLIPEIKETAKRYPPGEYIRIYFNEDNSLYKSESSIYLALKIYNDNKYSKDINNVVYGLSNYNMGLNSKKPYLQQKTKKLPTPFMITSDVAMKIKLFF